MIRTRTSRLATGTLLTILSIVPMYGCNSQQKPEPTPYNPPQTQISQPDPIDVLKKANEELELKAINLELKKRIEELQKKGHKENGEYKLREENARFGNDNANYLLKINQQRREISELELKTSMQREELRGCYVNSELNENYPLRGFEQVLQRQEVSYDREILMQRWSVFTSAERQSFYLAYNNKDMFYYSFSDAKKERYDEFYRKGMTTEDKKEIEATTGMTGLDIRKSPLSLAVFQMYEIKRTNDSIPPVR